MDSQRYVGRDVVLMVCDEGGVTPAQLGTEARSMLEQRMGGMSKRMEGMSMRITLVCDVDLQMAELAELLEADSRVVEPRYLVQKRQRISKGKGQRKANRRDRWR